MCAHVSIELMTCLVRTWRSSDMLIQPRCSLSKTRHAARTSASLSLLRTSCVGRQDIQVLVPDSYARCSHCQPMLLSQVCLAELCLQSEAHTHVGPGDEAQ